MATASWTGLDSHLPPAGADGRVPPFESVWQSPLVPATLALTAGILLYRHHPVPLLVSLAVTAAGLVAWLIALPGPQKGLPLVFLALSGVAFGAAYHGYRRDVHAPDDIGLLVPAEPADPVPVRLRGALATEPWVRPAPSPDPLRARAPGETTLAILEVSHLRRDGRWVPVSGQARLRVEGVLTDLHAGDSVEVVGRLARLPSPSNPGEWDASGYYRDQGVRALVTVYKTARGVTRLERGWPASPRGWIAVVRGWGQDVLREALPQRTGPLACALLLGEGAPMRAEDWEKYVHTGVIHVLAISGQHLVVLALFLGLGVRLLGLRLRYAAWLVAGVLFAYALVTGMRPPALRAAVTVCAVSGALILRRPALSANLFALAWLVVALADPTDLFQAGCLFSFLAVALLHWGTRGCWFPWEAPDPLDEVIDAARPSWLRALRRLGFWIIRIYAVNAFVWLLITPLAAARYHLVSPIALLIGPPLMLLTAVALILGFLLLLCAVVCPPLTVVFAVPVNLCLRLCEFTVDTTLPWPGGHFYVGDVPDWWLWAFYLGLLAFLTQGPLRRLWRWGALAGLGWLCLGLAVSAVHPAPDELRCTFLAVGHGGCTVLETPDGRTILYDAGSLGGPDVARRQVAPFLWHRGVRRIDEVFLSHADLDHFNGLRDLLDRFAVAQVSCTPSFFEKETPSVHHLRALLDSKGVPLRMVSAGDVLQAGEVTLEVLHPPAVGPPGQENVRSLVLEVRHAGHTMLLTGDIEGEGLSRLLASPPRRADVLMAPHHGSLLANPDALAEWAQPRVVVASRGPPWGANRYREPDSAAGARYFGTWPHGAVTVHSHAGGLVVETFVTGERLVVRRGGE
jgi:competence protein ComEC